jgi:hypothetical protein
VQRLGDEVLADLGAVGVGGVDQVHAELGQAAKHGQRPLAIGGFAPDAIASDAHRAEADAPHGHVAAERQLACGCGSWPVGGGGHAADDATARAESSRGRLLGLGHARGADPVEHRPDR